MIFDSTSNRNRFGTNAGGAPLAQYPLDIRISKIRQICPVTAQGLVESEVEYTMAALKIFGYFAEDTKCVGNGWPVSNRPQLTGGGLFGASVYCCMLRSIKAGNVHNPNTTKRGHLTQAKSVMHLCEVRNYRSYPWDEMTTMFSITLPTARMLACDVTVARNDWMRVFDQVETYRNTLSATLPADLRPSTEHVLEFRWTQVVALKVRSNPTDRTIAENFHHIRTTAKEHLSY